MLVPMVPHRQQLWMTSFLNPQTAEQTTEKTSWHRGHGAYSQEVRREPASPMAPAA